MMKSLTFIPITIFECLTMQQNCRSTYQILKYRDFRTGDPIILLIKSLTFIPITILGCLPRQQSCTSTYQILIWRDLLLEIRLINQKLTYVYMQGLTMGFINVEYTTCSR